MEEKESVITVTGNGGVHIVPDVTRVQLSLVSLHDTYKEAYAQGREDSETLSKVMQAVGLDTSVPKTIRFDITKKIRHKYDNSNHIIGEEFLGYELDHEVKIDLGMDTILLNKMIQHIGASLKQVEISIGYTVKDTRAAQLKIVERATADAREKAEIMTKVCGCKLGMVKSINYAVEELTIYTQARTLCCAEEATCCDEQSLDIHPDDFTAGDTVTVVWYLCPCKEGNE